VKGLQKTVVKYCILCNSSADADAVLASTLSCSLDSSICQCSCKDM